MDTKSKIISTGLKILHKDGLNLLSTKRVCREAKITPPTLYHHFKNKQELIDAIIEEAFLRFLKHKESYNRIDDPIIMLREGWDRYVEFSQKEPQVFAAMSNALLLGSLPKIAYRGFEILLSHMKQLEIEGKLLVSADEAAQSFFIANHGYASILSSGIEMNWSGSLSLTIREALLNGLVQNKFLISKLTE